MNERILHVLEFQKVIEQLNKQTATSLGKDQSSKLAPSTDFAEVLQLQKETDETSQIVRLNKEIPLGGVFDIRPSLKRSEIGGMLSAQECLDVASTVYGGRMVKNFMEELELDLPILQELSGQITPLRELEQQIKSCIDERAYMMDSASSKLRSIRSSIRTFESRIREKLDNYTKSNSKMLSDAIVTIRNDRYVLPVKQEHRGSIGGIVHDQSSSGQTLFMEPRSVVDLNNQLQETVIKEKQEVERILMELSGLIASDTSFLGENVRILGHIDFMMARAKLGADMKASRPKMNEQGYINMKQARHPLISADDAVANDVELGDSYTAIVITGPNTGGKTVALKMIGLCTLMAQSGLQVPAMDGCELAVFQDVLADIGDEQSIEQSLSTFSSHMTNIVNIMDKVDHQSLVLFDELGSGTDPQEGAALAMSILDEVVSRNARVIATTHYPELKAYGFNRENVVNASVEFDIDTLQPTYRLLIGIPGRSNAFEISRRLGLNDQIIRDAQELIGTDSKSVENMIASLDQSRIAAEKEYEEAHQILEQSEELQRDIKKMWNQYTQEREKLYKKAEEKANKALANAREEAEIIVNEIREMKSNVDVKEHEWIEAKKMLEEAQPDLSKKQEKKKVKTNDNKQTLQPGDEVKLLTVNQNGEVLEKISDREYFVQVGIMKVKVKRDDLQPLGKTKPSKQTPVAQVRGSQYHVSTELDLRGERYEEAMQKLEKYIDSVVLAGYQQATIIHGKGTGALRKGVKKFAEGHPNIASQREGGSGEGGNGVTIVKIR